MKGFSIEPGSRVALYGLNENSEKLTRILRSHRVTVAGVIDRKFPPSDSGETQALFADGDSVPAIAVDSRLERYHECAAVICLHNGMIHRPVARLLRSYGFRKLIYLPMDGLTPQNDASLIRRAYLYLMKGEVDRARNLPFYQETDVPLIDRGEGWVSFWCPAELLYTHSREMLDASADALVPARYAAMLPYCGVPLAEYAPYVDFFRALKIGGGGGGKPHYALFTPAPGTRGGQASVACGQNADVSTLSVRVDARLEFFHGQSGAGAV